MTRKAASKVWVNRVNERDDAIRAFVEQLSEVDLADVISIDETSIDTRLSPKFGYCLRGRRLPPMSLRRARCRVTMICGATVSGIQTAHCIVGSANTASFLTFVQELVRVCPQKVVLLDNVAFHKNKAVLDAFSCCGKQVIFLPPYCPHLNPVEHVFSSLKGHFRMYNHSAGTEDPLTPEEVDSFLSCVWKYVAPADWTDTFAHCLRAGGMK
jgi:transposase